MTKLAQCFEKQMRKKLRPPVGQAGGLETLVE
jgi:hypothetical protein